jgi:hypothetical protein
MDPPELTNFGSLIRFALELEADSASLYIAASRLLGPGPWADLARELAEQHEGRRRLLERTRQQKLNEMVLEPISGLEGNRYVFDAVIGNPGEVPWKAAAIEEVASLFYGESSVVAKALLTEAARTFQKLADENRRNLARIRETLSA